MAFLVSNRLCSVRNGIVVNCTTDNSHLSSHGGFSQHHFQYSFWQLCCTYGPSRGRLNYHSAYIAEQNNKGQWIQVDFRKVAKVTTIGTQGRYYRYGQYPQWVSKYTVSFSVNGGYFENQLYKSSDFHRVSLKFCLFGDRHKTMMR